VTLQQFGSVFRRKRAEDPGLLLSREYSSMYTPLRPHPLKITGLARVPPSLISEDCDCFVTAPTKTTIVSQTITDSVFLRIGLDMTATVLSHDIDIPDHGSCHGHSLRLRISNSSTVLGKIIVTWFSRSVALLSSLLTPSPWKRVVVTAQICRLAMPSLCIMLQLAPVR
jgi:hypothetical protein